MSQLWIFQKDSYKTPFFPVKYVPEWFPGAGFKKFARVAKENIDKSVNLPFQHVKESFQVREPRLFCEFYTEPKSRRTRLPLLRSRRRASRNYRNSVKMEWMKRRSAVLAGQYISVSVVIMYSIDGRCSTSSMWCQGGEETVGETESISYFLLTVPL